jgi:hypothetical protein
MKETCEGKRDILAIEESKKKKQKLEKKVVVAIYKDKNKKLENWKKEAISCTVLLINHLAQHL